MPYSVRKQKCKKSAGGSGNWVMSYTDRKGKKHRNCHGSEKGARAQIAAIEMGEGLEAVLVDLIREELMVVHERPVAMKQDVGGNWSPDLLVAGEDESLDESLAWDPTVSRGFMIRQWGAYERDPMFLKLQKDSPVLAQKLRTLFRPGSLFSVAGDDYAMTGTERGALGMRVSVAPGTLSGGEENPKWAPQPAGSILLPGWFVQQCSQPFRDNVPVAGRKL